ncbi:MAG TPA: NAD(P)-dependent oxidoreductase [Caulobacteraceae bacterium]|jgi:nucleoside-diphosphate-sugar epimerase|nr:NAD(P)-dependent oxidoreductase [Caulobacteraceae bacterium]
MTSRPIAALTGATGFLGAHLVQALDAAGFSVRVLARREPSPPGWGEVRPEVIPGDLSDPDALARLVEGAKAVVHAAGAIKADDLAGFMRVNRDGTVDLARACRVGAPEAPFVLVSSLAARQPELSAYAASKRAGETVAVELLGERATVIRPPAIYGPGDRETLAIFRAAATSPLLPVLSADARMALVHVEDAARTVAALALAPAPGVWALADSRPEGYGWREILAAAAAAVGRGPALVPVPAWALPGLARIGVAAGLLSREKVGEILHKDWAIRPEDLAPGAPPVRWSLDEGFAATADWYRRAGWLG